MNDKMVHDYLEGELNSVDQELLFAELNRSPQLRDELDFQMKLNRMMEMDRNASTTPTSSITVSQWLTMLNWLAAGELIFGDMLLLCFYYYL